MVAQHIGIALTIQEVDIAAGDTQLKDFLKVAAYSLDAHPRVRDYYSALKRELPYFTEINDKGIAMFRKKGTDVPCAGSISIGDPVIIVMPFQERMMRVPARRPVPAPSTKTH
ncbi:hypothetical protein IscW_ISCW002861 [Ixodes scapularis]|uniref:Uncharacterized protein n=1 Tax=Ixodes scapularis TaxID=6945 RepID=B7P7P0_IXOSC|nr:hypothetical protein IscW_ISCW002861 [Ixodes scapularis]|eukprot:XP_002399409.1 hypothetical protein IscW_ISCW002861 [Ixodes scapularis]